MMSCGYGSARRHERGRSRGSRFRAWSRTCALCTLKPSIFMPRGRERSRRCHEAASSPSPSCSTPCWFSSGSSRRSCCVSAATCRPSTSTRFCSSRRSWSWSIWASRGPTACTTPSVPKRRGRSYAPSPSQSPWASCSWRPSRSSWGRSPSHGRAGRSPSDGHSSSSCWCRGDCCSCTSAGYAGPSSGCCWWAPVRSRSSLPASSPPARSGAGAWWDCSTRGRLRTSPRAPRLVDIRCSGARPT